MDVSPSPQQKEFNILLDAGNYILEVHRPHSKIVVVLDDSGSMKNSVELLRQAVKSFISSKLESEFIGLIKFSDKNKISIINPFSKNNTELLPSFSKNNLKANGGAALYDAMKTGVELIDNVVGDKAMLLLSDGADSHSKRS